MGSCCSLLELGVPKSVPRVKDAITESVPDPVEPGKFIDIVRVWLIETSPTRQKVVFRRAFSTIPVAVSVTDAQWSELKRFITSNEVKIEAFSFFPTADSFSLVVEAAGLGLFVFPPLFNDPQYGRWKAVTYLGTDRKCFLRESAFSGKYLVESDGLQIRRTDLTTCSSELFRLEISGGVLAANAMEGIKVICGTRHGEVVIRTKHKDTPYCFGLYVISQFAGGVAFAEAVDNGTTYAEYFAILEQEKVMLLETGRYQLLDIRSKERRTLSETHSFASSWYMLDDKCTLMRVEGYDARTLDSALAYSLI
jgi:hypothetical protein